MLIPLTEDRLQGAEQSADELSKQRCCCHARAELDLLGKRLGHDLRAPLRAIKMLPQWIAEDLQEAGISIPDGVVEQFQKLETQAERMDRFLIGVLEFVQVAAANQRRELVSPEKEIEDLLAELAPACAVTVDIAPELAKLSVVRADFVAVLRHIICNCVTHCNATKIRIHCLGRRVGQTAVIEIADNGTGIAESELAKVFEPFSTLQPRDEIDTSGLGLAVVKKIVTSWNGEVSVAQASAGGVAVRFQFPIQLDASGA